VEAGRASWILTNFKDLEQILYTNSIHVGFEVFTTVVMKNIIFWDMTPCSPSSFNRRFGRTTLPPACLLVFAELISSTLKMEAICSSGTSVETRRATWRHIPDDDTLPTAFGSRSQSGSTLKRNKQNRP
jgi:hypothetical protein